MTDELAIRIYEAHAARIGQPPKWPKLASYTHDHWRMVAEVAREVVEGEKAAATVELGEKPE